MGGVAGAQVASAEEGQGWEFFKNGFPASYFDLRIHSFTNWDYAQFDNNKFFIKSPSFSNAATPISPSFVSFLPLSIRKSHN